MIRCICIPRLKHATKHSQTIKHFITITMLIKGEGISLLLPLTIILVIRITYGAVGIGRQDTSDGYCDLDGYERIPVGEVGYHAEKCMQANCYDGGYTLYSCGAVAVQGNNCKIVPGTGQYPDCCKYAVCNVVDSKIED